MDSCSWAIGVPPFGPIVWLVLVLLRLVLMVPLCEPVLEELLEFVLLGEAAVGTRCPYCCKREEREKRILVSLDIKMQLNNNNNDRHVVYPVFSPRSHAPEETCN